MTFGSLIGQHSSRSARHSGPAMKGGCRQSQKLLFYHSALLDKCVRDWRCVEMKVESKSQICTIGACILTDISVEASFKPGFSFH